MSSNLDNADFSRMLAVGDADLAAFGHRGGGNNKKKRPRPEGKGKGKGKGKGEKEEEGPQWRDRAKERRLGENEYKQVAEEFEQHKEVSVEESKFLGGDMDHTHLVKGLDYSLLSKVKAELSKYSRIEQRTIEIMKKKDRAKRKVDHVTLVGRKVYQAVVETLHPHHFQFRQRLDRMSRSIGIGQRIRGAPANFQPGRMCYVFDTNMKMGYEDVPTIMYRSKDECEKMDWSQKPAAIDLRTLEKVQTALVENKTRRKEARELKRSKLEAKPAAAEDDIFQGVGSFDPTQTTKDVKAPLRGKSYFDSDFVPTTKNTAALAKDFEPAEAFMGSRDGWVYKRGEHGLGYYREGAVKASALRAGGVKRFTRGAADDEAYADCFPNVRQFDHKASDGKAEKEGKGKGKGKGLSVDELAKRRKEKEREKEEKYATEASKHFGKKEGDRKKQKLTEDQQWKKIEEMIEKRTVPTMEGMEDRARQKKHR